LSYWRCILSHYFKVSPLSDKHMRLRDISHPDCTVCGSKVVYRTTKTEWEKETGRLQCVCDTTRKNLRNRFMEDKENET